MRLSRTSRRRRERSQPARSRRVGPRALHAQTRRRRARPATARRAGSATATSARRRDPRRRCGRTSRSGAGSAHGNPGHSAESTTSRSHDVDDLVELGRPPGRLAAPAAERGQVGDQQREHDRGWVLHRRARGRSSITSAKTSRRHPDHGVFFSRRASRTCGLPRRGSRYEEDRPRRMALLEPRDDCPRLGQPARRRPDEVRHRARPQVGAVVLELRRTAAPPARARSRRPRPSDVAQCRRQLRPSRCNSSSAAVGPHVPAS